MLCLDIEKKLSSFTLRVNLKAEGATALIGPSGCGKSVTLKCIAGIMKPDRGYIEHDGTVLFDSERNINLPPQKRRIGYLFQSYALFQDMTVYGNISAGLRWEKDRALREKMLDDTVEMLHIGHLLKSKPYQLSGGEAQRVALARMIVNRPEMMLFDEPFSALDIYLKEEIKAQFKSIVEKIGKDYMIVTHSMDEAYSLSSSLSIIDQGKIIRSGMTDEVFQDPVSARAAAIMGYRNIEKAECDNGTVYVPGWNVDTGKTAEGACAVAVMDNDIEITDSGRSAAILRIIKSPAATSVELLLEGASSPIWIKTAAHIPDQGTIRISFREGALKILTS